MVSAGRGGTDGAFTAAASHRHRNRKGPRTDLEIAGKFGASAGGLGLAAARRLGMEACRAAICDNAADKLADAVEAMEAAAPDVTVFAYPVDLTRPEDIESLVQQVTSDLGPVAIRVTHSGGPPPGTFENADDAKWRAAFELTFLSAVRLIRLVLPGMKAARWGRIVNFSSRALREPIDTLVLSNAVRLAVAGMAKTLAAEVAALGITVNNIGPGPNRRSRRPGRPFSPRTRPDTSPGSPCWWTAAKSGRCDLSGIWTGSPIRSIGWLSKASTPSFRPLSWKTGRSISTASHGWWISWRSGASTVWP